MFRARDRGRNIFRVEQDADANGVPSFAARLDRALAVSEAIKDAAEESDDAAGLRWLSTVDRSSHVGSLHHTVPRFMLQQWASRNQVRIYSRVDKRFSVRNTKDIGVRDFYTLVNTDGHLESTLESLLREVERSGSAVISRLLSPFYKEASLRLDDFVALADLAAFQVVRTTRRRRELEVHADWYGKTMAAGRVPDEELRKLSIVPDQNGVLSSAMNSAREIMPMIAMRPLAIVWITGAQFLLGDEPLLANVGSSEAGHHPDCFLTEADMQKRFAAERRKKKGDRRRVTRVIHFQSKTGGIGTALELAMPISPHAALWWGPLIGPEWTPDSVEVERLSVDESARFAALANRGMCSQSLEWVVSTLDDAAFQEMDMLDSEPLLSVCDGDNAAALAVNTVPERLRPYRLTRPK